MLIETPSHPVHQRRASDSSISSAGSATAGPSESRGSRLGPDGPRDENDRPINHEFGEGVGNPTKKTGKRRGVRAPTTWHLKAPYNFNTWVMHHDLGPEEIYYTLPEKPDTALPFHPIWRENVFILQHAFRPIAVQALWYTLFPQYPWHWFFAFMFYTLSIIDFALNHIRRLNRYQGVYGVFDQENRGRDMISDKQVNWVAGQLVSYMAGRIVGVFILGWNQTVFPTVSWWFPVKIGLWGIALDYYFYSYHRSCHEVDALWHVHQRHHASHHPTPLLSIYADDIQEALEVAIVPYLGTKTLEIVTGITLSFPEMYLAVCYLLYYESYGHAGIRAVWGHPIHYYPLRLFGMELIGEDHDIHHRDGKGGRNYGKQTRVWDKIFGTIEGRREKQTYY